MHKITVSFQNYSQIYANIIITESLKHIRVIVISVSTNTLLLVDYIITHRASKERILCTHYNKARPIIANVLRNIAQQNKMTNLKNIIETLGASTIAFTAFIKSVAVSVTNFHFLKHLICTDAQFLTILRYN